MKLLRKTKLNEKGFGHLEIVLLIVVVLAIGAGGFFVYKHSHKTTVAHASGTTYLGYYYGVTVSACATFDSYYDVYHVTTYFNKPASGAPKYYDAAAFYTNDNAVGGTGTGAGGNAYWLNVSGSAQFYVSKYSNQRFRAFVNSGDTVGSGVNGTEGTGLVNPANVAQC